MSMRVLTSALFRFSRPCTSVRTTSVTAASSITSKKPKEFVFGRANEEHDANNNIVKRTIYDLEKRRAQLDRLTKTEKLYTIPNILTLTRLATTPVVGYLIINGMNNYALYYFAASAMTDFLDGLIARTFPSQATRLGAILDPVADKVLLMTCFITLCHVDLIPFYIAKMVIFRDISLLSVGAFIRYFGFAERPTIKKYFDFGRYPTENLHPTKLSKINTSLQCSLVVATLWSTIVANPEPWAIPLILLQCTTFVTTFATLGQYMQRMNRTIFSIKIK